jgi:hypothetical protein
VTSTLVISRCTVHVRLFSPYSHYVGFMPYHNFSLHGLPFAWIYCSDNALPILCPNRVCLPRYRAGVACLPSEVRISKTHPRGSLPTTINGLFPYQAAPPSSARRDVFGVGFPSSTHRTRWSTCWDFCGLDLQRGLPFPWLLLSPHDRPQRMSTQDHPLPKSVPGSFSRYR